MTAAAAWAALLCPVSLAAPDSLLGFRAASCADELAREKAFDGAVSPSDMRSWLEQMSSEPNQVGSPHDKANADFMQGLLTEWGWDAHIETFYVLYPTPKSETVEMVAPVAFRARLSEGPVEGDRTSSRTQGGLPPISANLLERIFESAIFAYVEIRLVVHGFLAIWLARCPGKEQA